MVYCTSGYKSNSEKVALFLFPKNEVLKNEWVRAIPRKNLIFCPKTVICEKHFTNDQIIRTWESGTGSNKIVVSILIKITFYLSLQVKFIIYVR